jgi:hypothetical protein
MQFKGQRDGQQPLVAVMIASFVLNHVVALLESVCYNIGLYPASWIITAVFECNCFGDWKPKPWGKFHFRLVMFAVMNLSGFPFAEFLKLSDSCAFLLPVVGKNSLNPGGKSQSILHVDQTARLVHGALKSRLG